MNDFDYDAKEKKRIANNAHRMNRTKPGCHLPSDNLTEAQIRKKHGEVFSMNINKPMTYEEWKQLPKDMKELYYNSIVDRFGVGLNRIAKMMQCDYKALYGHIKSHKLDIKRVKKGGVGAKSESWNAFCEGIKVQEVPVNIEAPEEKVIVEEKKRVPIMSYHLHFNGVQSWEEVLQMLETMPLPKDAVISIHVQKGVAYESDYAE